ncbi:aldehyde dehydrogenase (NADP(+)) [Streptomyces sp. NPDC005438]|uniref:aldehyde dehydrogenase (NADP(+)) n=1 Tax=Streptomyces sp. NPDC005438 TaxID=3156880 RepID=UPI0033BB7612
MSVTGAMFLGAQLYVGDGEPVVPVAAATGEVLPPSYPSAGPEEVARACALAAEAAPAFRATAPGARAELLEAIAANIEALGEELVERAVAESGLPTGRISGEVGRTTGQLRLFARELREGGWAGVRVDPALPDRTPAPRPDLRQRRLALGPVAVFGASNFPLAFSVAGGDTASALAAGCPVVVKGHNAHPGTSELVGSAVAEAVTAAGLPPGVFSLLFGTGDEIGAALVADPRIRAVAFTGSRAGGLALSRIAAARPVPVPVYAEMSSVNPVFLLPGALAARPTELARGFVGSLTLGAGQFCTNPGLVVAVEGPGWDSFVSTVVEEVAAAPAQTMLTPRIGASYREATGRLAADGTVRHLTPDRPHGTREGVPQVFSVTARDLLDRPELGQETFGAASVLVRCADLDELFRVASEVEGQLTATVHGEFGSASGGAPEGAPDSDPGSAPEGGTTSDPDGPGDRGTAARLLPVLETLAGRVLFDGWPTGVEVGHAMVHGGPYPATSDSRTTSVGTLAVERFLRPVCYQDVPDFLLPPEVADANPYRLPRRVDGHRES